MPNTELTETGAVGALPERDGSQRREITLIRAGWGSSGYYSEEVLERDGPKAFPVGTHMYIDHPTSREKAERPERSVRDLAATIVSTPRMSGISLVAEAKIMDHWAPVIDALADSIGTSIMAEGVVESGAAGGKDGPIVKALTKGHSVDFVTKPGAGGKIGKLIESARAQAVQLDEKRTPDDKPSPKSPDDKEKPMDNEKKLEELSETVRQLTDKTSSLAEQLEEAESARKDAITRAERAEDKILATEAARVIHAALADVKGLPDRAQKRVAEAALATELPVNKEGDLIEAELKERVTSAAKSELEYLTGAIKESKIIVGTSEAPNDDSSGGDHQDELVEAFRRLGLSEDAAKFAAEGR